MQRGEDKIHLVPVYRNMVDYLVLAGQFGIKRSSARSIVFRSMKNGDPDNIRDKQRGGCHVKVNEEMREVIADIIGRNPGVTLKSLNIRLRE